MRRRLLLLALFLAIPSHAAITGRVLDQDGAPVAGARVRAFAREPMDAFFARALSQTPEPQPIVTASAADDGTFTIETKGNGVVDLVAEAPGKSTNVTQAIDGEDVGVLIVRAAERRRGRVTAAGKPVAGALITNRLFAVRTDPNGTYETADWEGFDTPWVVHPDFAIDRATPPRDRNALRETALTSGVALRGRVVADDGQTAVANALITVDGWPMARSGEDGSFVIAHVMPKWRLLTAVEGTRTVTTTPKNAASYTLQLRPGATINGTVRNGKTSTPVSSVTVLVTRDSEGSSQRSAVTDAKGNFTIRAVGAGGYTIYATHPSYQTRPGELRVGEGARVQRDLVLSPLARISGTVVDEERKPVAGASMSFNFGGPSTVTSTDGRYTLKVPSFGSQGTLLIARKRGYALGVLGPMKVPEGELKSGATIVLPRGFELRLRVVDRQENALPEEPVRIARSEDEEFRMSRVVVCGEAWPCRTGSDGTTTIRLTEGRYDLAIGGGSAATKELPAQIVTAQSSPLTVVLDRGVEVAGRVTYSDGSAVTDTNVNVFVSGDRFVPGRQTPNAPVGPDGSFVFKNLPPGRVSLYARATSQQAGEGPPVEITAPAADVVLTLPKPVRLEGRVVEKGTMQPVRDFTIALRRYRGSGYTMNNQSFVADDGRFTLETSAETKLDLIVTAPGYAPSTASSVILTADKMEPLTIQVDRGAKLVVHVTAEGRAVMDAQVRISGAPREFTPPPRWSGTDADGNFIFDSLGAGDYTLNVTKEGFAGARQTVEATLAKESKVEIELNRGRELRGRVLDSAGTPIAGARITFRAGPSAGSMSTGPTETDSSGSFTIQGILDGPHMLMAEKSGYVPGTAEGVDPSKTSTVTITLQRGGTISGRVIGASESEMPAIRIAIFGGNSRQQGRPEASGNFTISGVPDGRLSVRAFVPGMQSRQTATKAVEVINGSAPPVDLEFVAGIPVRGRVTRDGAPVPMAGITFNPKTREGGYGTASGQTRSDGTYEVSVPTPGDYNVLVAAGPGVPIDVGAVTVNGAMTHDIAIRGTTLRGRVIDESSGAPVAGVLVEMSRTNPRGPGGNAMTDSEGRFSVDLLPAGSYSVRATKQRYAPTTQSIEVLEGQPADVELRLRGGERVPIRVVDAVDRRPLDVGSISVSDSSKKVVYGGQLTRDAQGNAAVWLLPGRYTARVFVPQYTQETVEIVVPGPETIVAMRRAGRVVVQGTREGAIRARATDMQTGKVVAMVSLPPGIFENLAPGAYKIELLDRNQAVLDGKTAVVNPGETLTVTFN